MSRNTFLTSTVPFFLVFVDQLSKYLIRSRGGFYICNKGMAFGISLPEPVFWLFWLFWIGIIVLLMSALYKKTIIHPHAGEAGNSLFIILIIAGAIGNMIDRLRFGCVIDFINLKFWPVFNLADIFITLGAILLLYSFLKNKNPRELG